MRPYETRSTRDRSIYHAQLSKVSFDESLDLTGVVFEKKTKQEG